MMIGVIDHAPILIVIIPLLAAFLTPVIEMISAKIRDAVVLASIIVTIGVVSITAVKLAEGGFKPIIYTLGAAEPLPLDYAVPVRILIVIDGLSILMALLISIIALLSLIYSWKYMGEGISGLDSYYTLFLLLIVGLLGIVITGDVFNLYVFLEIAAISSYALVAFNKDTPESMEAAIKYLIVGSIATAFILLGVALLYGQYGTLTMAQLAYEIQVAPSLVGNVALALFITGFAIKAGIVPMHLWVADAYTVAPTPISIFFSGIASKIALYALFRVSFTLYGPSINETTIGWIFILFALITIFVGTSMALLQNDFKRLLAYSSVSQVGYILLGVGVGLSVMTVNQELGIYSINAGIFHLLNHALFGALLFMIAGVILRQVGRIKLNELGGLAEKMPVTTICFLIASASVIGIPPFNGFASKWLIYISSAIYNPILPVIAIAGSVLTAGAYAKVFHGAFSGRELNEFKDVKEASLVMLMPMIILAISCIVIGLFPAYVVDMVISPATEALLNQERYIITVLGLWLRGGA